ncbi:potassium channel family protein [Roseisalinus antarcticus]|uniref:Ktr system potassium uptake protein A n=1 Tax=Roseisalinus antarcticus TaxID=254357 RepID=A0A1Y5SAK3_9RHOB|nr:TrkA family potassium uptake protein [Roseisalinus antarcticus]SLN36266.1 Ktr system potassium uptake protein A [Roseisalinus antarcticus]
MARRNRTIAVLGLGNFGAVIASELARFGNDVIGIDVDRRIVSDQADKLGQALILDARDEAALREAGIADCDAAVVAMATNIEVSILSVMNLKLLGVRTIWAKAVSRTHHRILSKLGVDRVIHPEEEMGRTIAQMIHNPLIRDLASLGNGNYVVNFIVPPSLAGKRVEDLDLPSRHEVRAIGVMRGSDWLGGETCDTALSEDDKLILLGSRTKLRSFAEGL